jgi:PAS domain S-box-containing protein
MNDSQAGAIEALRESESRYRMLMEQASDGIHTYDLEGNFIEVNSRLCEMLGYTREELLRLKVNDLIPLEDLAATPIRFDDLRAGKTIISERRVRRKDGTLLPVEISGRMFQSGMLQAIIRDITERKRVEEMLRASERFAYSTLNALSEHIAVLDEQGNIVAINQAWRDFAMSNALLPEKVSEGANYLAACDRAEGEGESAQQAFAVAGAIRAIIKNERSEFFLEYACHCASVQRWFIVRVTRFLGDGPTRLVVAHENITARKQAEDKLKQSEEWLRSIFEASRDGILVEEDERIVYVNKSYLLLFGYEKAEDVTGGHISVLMSPDDRDRLLEYGRRRLHGEGAPFIYEFKGKRKDATLIELEAVVSTSIVSGRSYIITAIRDITKRKQTEEALRLAHDELESRVAERTAELSQANEARKELLRRLVSAQEAERRRIALELHDQMGQHLTALTLGLKTLSNLCQRSVPAQNHIEQLQVLTNELIQETHTLAWELRPTALDDLGLHTALVNYVEQWSARTLIPVDFHSTGFDDRRLHPSVETALYRIIQESLTNVLKHAQANRVSLILEHLPDHVFAIVEDNGRGFDVEPVIGEPVKERGLGLLGMRERVALIGGTLNIESSPGVGTSVFVRIQTPLDEQGRKSVE